MSSPFSNTTTNSNSNRDLRQRYSTELLLFEYLGLIRDQITNQTRIMQSYSRTIETSSNNLTNLLQRYLDIQSNFTTLDLSLFNRPNPKFNTYFTFSKSISAFPNYIQTHPRRRQVRRPRNLTRQPTTRKHWKTKYY